MMGESERGAQTTVIEVTVESADVSHSIQRKGWHDLQRKGDAPMSTQIAVKPQAVGRTTLGFPYSRSFFEDMDNLTNRIAQRAFGLFEERGTDGKEWEDWLRAEAELLKPMPVELSEAEKEYTVKAEVP
jgi:hypothetical protein